MKSFEELFARLETILQKMNEPGTSLENSLTLFTEADLLIKQCEKKLGEAEEKVQILLKNRDGSLKTDEEGQPEIVEFSS
ncbi:MAG: exodeoxyribonuclease VII small subunit [Chlamydiota bacterium]